MKVEEMSAARHDKVMALMSHLPHLIAYTIVGTAADLETETREDVIKYAAGGFRDFTRIAGSDPVMWRDIFLNNRVSEHPGIHSRRDKFRAGTGHNRSGQHVIGDSAGDLSDDICRSRRNNNQIRLFR